MMMKFRMFLSAVVLVVAGAGCSYNQMHLINYANAEKPEDLQQVFTQASFFDNSTGGYEILLQSTEPIDDSNDRVLRQAIYISTIWKPIPGKTYAETTQLNARIIYLVEIANRPGGVVQTQEETTFLCYKGSGFVSFAVDQTKQVLTGRIEQAILTPVHKSKSHRLGTFELIGDFKAQRNPSAIGEFKILAGSSIK